MSHPERDTIHRERRLILCTCGRKADLVTGEVIRMLFSLSGACIPGSMYWYCHFCKKIAEADPVTYLPTTCKWTCLPTLIWFVGRGWKLTLGFA